jgi:hypothetical protein
MLFFHIICSLKTLQLKISFLGPQAWRMYGGSSCWQIYYLSTKPKISVSVLCLVWTSLGKNNLLVLLCVCVCVCSFLLACTNYTKHCHCAISIHVYNYFGLIHSLYCAFMFPFPSFKTNFNGFHYSIFIHEFKGLKLWSFSLHPFLSVSSFPSHWLPFPNSLVLYSCHSFIVVFCLDSTYKRTYKICLFQSGLFHLTWSIFYKWHNFILLYG